MNYLEPIALLCLCVAILYLIWSVDSLATAVDHQNDALNSMVSAMEKFNEQSNNK